MRVVRGGYGPTRFASVLQPASSPLHATVKTSSTERIEIAINHEIAVIDRQDGVVSLKTTPHPESLCRRLPGTGASAAARIDAER